jgi:GT2 family glycosyltransferase
MKVAIIVVTYGRKELVVQTVARLSRQTRRPDAIVISAPDESHVAPIHLPDIPISYVFGATGSAVQRNLAIENAPADCDIIIFFDDDYLPADDYVERTVEAFERNASWHVLTGHVVRDGINGRGFSIQEGNDMLAGSANVPLEAGDAQDWHGGYGCNMAVRVSAVGTERFDERLALYGWQEDVDFTRRVARRGRIIRHSSLRGVHLGQKSGRTSGVRMGYSQMVNPAYLVRKGTFTPAMAVRLMIRNFLANVGRSFWPEPWVDRRGRLKGNALALWHLLGGRIQPEYILKL